MENPSGNEDTELSVLTTETAAEAADLVSGLAGRELNRAVAERVMGLHVQFSNALGGDWVGTSIEEGYARVLPYSTDIAAAMEVVEKLRERKLAVTIMDTDDSVTGNWCVTFDTGVKGFEAESGSLPEAICRAALAAIEATSQHARLPSGTTLTVEERVLGFITEDD